MTVRISIADSEIDPESPGTTTLFTKLRDNPESDAEGMAIFTASGNFTAPQTGAYEVYVLGAGQAGGNGASATAGGGAGANGVIVKIILNLTASSNYTVTVGTKGAKGVGSGSSGGAGGSSTFDTTTAAGGTSGNGGTSGDLNGVGGNNSEYGLGGTGSTTAADAADDATGHGSGGGGGSALGGSFYNGGFGEDGLVIIRMARG